MPIFLVVIATILALTHLYFWRRFVRATGWFPKHRKWAAATTVALVLLTLAGLMAGRRLSPDAAAPLAWLGGVWLGVTFLLLMLFLTVDLVRGTVWVARRASGAKPVDLDRRRLLSRAVAGGVGATALGASGVAVASGARAPEVVRVDVPI